MNIVYLDSSALLKLLIAEDESKHLTEVVNASLASGARLVTSALARVELSHARMSDELGGSAAWFEAESLNALFEAFDLVQITDEILDIANVIPFPVTSLQAIHLATGDMLRSELAVLISYDPDLLRVGKLMGLNAQVA